MSVHSSSGRPPILAIVYTDSAAACGLLSSLGYRLRDAGICMAGLVPYQVASDQPPRCDMEVEELASRFVLQLSDDHNKQDSGCRIDPAALEEAAALIAASFRKGPELLIINKFGSLEAAGGGLVDVISNAVDQGIPVIVGVPQRHLDAWRTFTNGLAEEAPVDQLRVQQWLARRGLSTKRELPGARRVFNSAA